MVNWKAAVALLAVLVGLAFFALQTRPGGKATKPPPGLLPCVVAEAVDVKVTGSDGKVTQAHRLTPKLDWKLVQPAAAPADSAAVDDLLVTAQQLRSSDSAKVPAGQDLGLEPPRATFTCTMRSGASYTLSIGSQNFDGSGEYARVSGDTKVHVIPAATAEKLQKVLAAPPYRPSPTPSGSPSPSPST